MPTNYKIDRRRILAIAGVSLASAAIRSEAVAADVPTYDYSAQSPDQSLAALKEGNARYVSEPQVCVLNLAKQRASVAAKQAPWATILSCADSRVPPELVFGGLGLGELFVARNAGNLADTATIGTLEYGAAVLGSPLIVVLGHTRCGAVSAACNVVLKDATFPGSIGPMIDPIIPAALAVRNNSGDYVDNSARESAQRTARRLADTSTTLSDLVRGGKLKIVAGHYDLDSGRVEFLA
jgi:carbonic anhydrase